LGLGLYTGISSRNGDNAFLAYNEGPLNKIAVEAGVPGFMALLLGVGLIIRAGLWTVALKDSGRKVRLIPIAIGALIAVAQGLWYDHVATGLWWWVIALWLGDALPITRTRTTIVRPSRQLLAVGRTET
jgi:hypothetical protein